MAPHSLHAVPPLAINVILHANTNNHGILSPVCIAGVRIATFTSVLLGNTILSREEEGIHGPACPGAHLNDVVILCQMENIVALTMDIVFCCRVELCVDTRVVNLVAVE